MQIDLTNAFSTLFLLDQCLQIYLDIYISAILHHPSTIISMSYHPLNEYNREGSFGPSSVLSYYAQAHKLIEKIESQNSSIQASSLLVRYFDDGSIVANPKVLADIIHLIQSDRPAFGLHINLEGLRLFGNPPM